MPHKNQNTLVQIRRGEIITAQYLNRLVTAVNRNTVAISGPRAIRRDNIDNSSNDEGGSFSDLTFTESSRSETTVTITDSNGDDVEVNQIDQVELINSNGEVLTLIFNNP